MDNETFYFWLRVVIAAAGLFFLGAIVWVSWRDFRGKK